MPKSTPSSSQPVRGQKSISSFFTSTPRPTVNGPQTQPVVPPPPANRKENIYDADTDADEDEDEDEEPIAASAKRSSSKRPLSEDVNAANGSGSLAERPAKKARSIGAGDGEDGGGSVYFGDKVGASAKEKGRERTKAPPRTEKYIYRSSAQSASDAIPAEAEDGDAAEKKRKEELHRRWVKKMAGVSVGRRWNSEDSTPVVEDGEGEADEEEEPAPTKTKRKGAKTGKLTPLEIQVLDIKRKHMDTLLIVEVGYKFKFFGEDARTAAKELSIVCIPGKFRYDEHPSEAHLDRFASASIPVHRLPVHAKRLVAAGHKIGVVRQIETAALKKAGDNRNAPFTRKLTNVYTKGTYIDDVDGLDHPTEGVKSGAPATGYLLCITEDKAKGWGTDEKVEVGILAVQPATGDIIYDTFEDGFMRSEIETRLLHIAPCEFLIVGELTKATDKLVKHLSGSSTNVFGDRIRVEHVAKGKTMAAEAHSHVTQFYANKLKAQETGSKEQTLLDKVLKLPEQVTVCLSAMITHMTEYGLEHVFDLTKYFQSFSARSHMLLNGNTLTSLEVYQNQTDHSEKGSLFWTLDKTQTRFGQRLLRKWVGRPLLDKSQLEERQDAVEELANGHQTPKVDKLQALLRSIRSDLERSLLRIYYGKCTRPEFLNVLKTLQSISDEYATVRGPADAGFKSSLLNSAIASLPSISEVIVSFLSQINAEAARTDDKYAFFHPDHETEDITDHKVGIAAVELDLDDHRKTASASLKKSKPLPYVTVAGIEYLFEIANSDLKNVPASWSKISGTKKVSRFHTPDVTKMLRERDQHKESLSAACDTAFHSLLSSLSTHYALLRDAILSLASLDCLLSLSVVARLPGYTKPVILPSGPSDPSTITISGGRHPMVEQLLPSYIPNSTSLSTAPDHTRALLITGPNMGGKSSYVRSVALLILLAQIGSFLPATSCHLSLFTSIHTRMGAYDSLFTAQSTFQVELSETSQILKTAGPKSLIILDELGRGTSTHDGTAIAGATLEYIVRETGGLCLFITHYQSLASVARGFEGGKELRNVHMRFESTKGASGKENGLGRLENGVGSKEEGATPNGEEEIDGNEEITFLYEVAPGVAHRSYGLNVARLAHVPKAVVDTAAKKSAEMEREMVSKKLVGLAKMMSGLLTGSQTEVDLDRLIVGIEEL